MSEHVITDEEILDESQFPFKISTSNQVSFERDDIALKIRMKPGYRLLRHKNFFAELGEGFIPENWEECKGEWERSDGTIKQIFGQVFMIQKIEEELT